MTTLALSALKDGGSSLATRSISPPVDRSKPPADAFSTSGRNGSPGTITPQQNGHIHNSPSPSASGIEDMKKREAWLKAALIRASRSGFIYADAQDPPEDLILDFANADQGETKRVVEMIMNLKHMRAAIQVRFIYFVRFGSEDKHMNSNAFNCRQPLSSRRSRLPRNSKKPKGSRRVPYRRLHITVPRLRLSRPPLLKSWSGLNATVSSSSSDNYH